MLVSVNSDVFSPFPTMIVDDGPQSSEDGSGLHSPIFGTHFHQDNIRYHPDHIDVHSAAGILASQFDSNYLPLPNNHPHHLLEPPLDIHHTHNQYSHEYPIPSRNHLALDLSPNSYSNARLPPPPSQLNIPPYQPHRRLPPDPRDHSYPSPPSPPAAILPNSDQRSPPVKREPAPSPVQNTSSPTQPPPPRREGSNLVIACRQCRARKIRCDSTRPICHNCVRRSNECQYDAVPKRRGPDKRPGTRQRSCKKRPADGSAPPLPPSKRKRTTPRVSDTQEGPEDRRPLDPPVLRTSDLQQDSHIRLNQPSLSPQGSELSSSATSRGLSADSYSTHPDRQLVDKLRIPASPSVQYNRKEWWDTLVNSYSTSSRDQSLKDIASDLSSLFTTTGCWLSFVDVPDFLRSLYNPEDRLLMQPSLVFAGLALATLIKSSEMELGTAGRTRAAWLRDQAQTSLETSWNAQWIDVTLAKAAVILAVFESSAHHLYTPERQRQSLIRMDHIVRALGLTWLDNSEPEVSAFAPNAVPVAHKRPYDGLSKDGLRSPRASSRKCSCISLSPNAPMVTDHVSSSWSYSPPFDSTWNTEEMNREACRRLCWSALNLVASYTSHCIAFRKEPTDLFLTDPSNYRLLFPGEVSERGSTDHKMQSPKDSMWALYCRSMLLWNFCTTRLRKNAYSRDHTSELALEAWHEAQEIQSTLDSHTCNLDMALLYMCREYVYKVALTAAAIEINPNSTQMMLTSILQTVQGREAGNLPSFSRKHMEHWLYHQSNFIRRVRMSVERLGEANGDLFRRPFQVTWFASQVSICLSLWENDNTLIDALEVAKDIIVPLDVLNTLWPCPMLQSKCDELRKRVTDACHCTNINPPLPPNCSLPLHIRGA